MKCNKCYREKIDKDDIWSEMTLIKRNETIERYTKAFDQDGKIVKKDHKIGADIYKCDNGHVIYVF